MITLGLTPPAREDRAATTRTYTTDQIGALTAATTAGPAAIATATAAVEIAAGIWGRALSLAIVSPQTARTRAITPSLLELAGRALARRGQVVFDLEIGVRGELALIPCAASNVLIGSPDPASLDLLAAMLRAEFDRHPLPPPGWRRALAVRAIAGSPVGRAGPVANRAPLRRRS